MRLDLQSPPPPKKKTSLENCRFGSTDSASHLMRTDWLEFSSTFLSLMRRWPQAVNLVRWSQECGCPSFLMPCQWRGDLGCDLCSGTFSVCAEETLITPEQHFPGITSELTPLEESWEMYFTSSGVTEHSQSSSWSSFTQSVSFCSFRFPVSWYLQTAKCAQWLEWIVARDSQLTVFDQCLLCAKDSPKDSPPPPKPWNRYCNYCSSKKKHTESVRDVLTATQVMNGRPFWAAFRLANSYYI